MRSVEVLGVGTTAFGVHLESPLAQLAVEAGRAACRDAGVPMDEIEELYFANAAGGVISGQEMIRGQVATRGSALEGVPCFNVENACASGSTAFSLAWWSVASGRSEVAIVIGAEKLHHADKSVSFRAIESGTDLSWTSDVTGNGSVMMSAYASEAKRYSRQHGADLPAALAAVAVKNRSFAMHNPAAQFRSGIDPADVAASREVADPLRLLMCSPLTDGAAAVVLSAARPREGASGPGVERVVVLASRAASYSAAERVVGRAARRALSDAGVGIDEIDVAQLHDACAFAEIQQYEDVGLAEVGRGASAVLSGDFGPHGRCPVNTDGGLLSRGHALGATGVAQIVELTTQLRGLAGSRQVAGAKVAFAMNSGGWMGEDYAAAVGTVLSTG